MVTRWRIAVIAAIAGIVIASLVLTDRLGSSPTHSEHHSSGASPTNPSRPLTPVASSRTSRPSVAPAVPTLVASAGSSATARPAASPTRDDADWLDAFPESQRALATEPGSITRMLTREVERLFPADEQRILVNPDGSQSTEDAPFDTSNIIPQSPIFIESRNEGGDDFDYVVVAFRDRILGDIPLIVTCLMRDGAVVPSAYSTYARGNRPPRYPFMPPEEAGKLLLSSGFTPERPPSAVFFHSAVSPNPVLFVYEFFGNERVVYVSQDGAVWRALAELSGPF